jgi:hypothetical protein
VGLPEAQMAEESSQFNASERIESAKAAVIGGFSLVLGFVLVAIARYFIPQVPVVSPLTLDGWLHGAIAFFSGFLFGVTYRYAVRRDRNFQLKSGVAAAFGLVRGFAEVDLGLDAGVELGQLALRLGESLVLFAIAGIILDFALQRGWVKPFGS